MSKAWIEEMLVQIEEMAREAREALNNGDMLPLKHAVDAIRSDSAQLFNALKA